MAFFILKSKVNQTTSHMHYKLFKKGSAYPVSEISKTIVDIESYLKKIHSHHLEVLQLFHLHIFTTI